MSRALAMMFFIVFGSFIQYNVDNLAIVLPVAAGVGVAIGHVCMRAYSPLRKETRW